METPKGSLREQAQRQLDADLAQIPAGHTKALVAIADGERIKVGVAVRLDDQWQLAGEIEKRRRQRPEARVIVRGSW